MSEEKWNPEVESLSEYKKRIGAKTQKGQVDVEGIERMREKLEEKEVEAESYKAKLHMVAEKKFTEKREEISERVSRVIKDEDKRKELLEKIEDSDLPMSERIRNMQGIELALDTIQNVKPKRKDISKPSGVVPLSSQTNSGRSEGYDSVEELVADLREKSHSEHEPTKREAREVLKALSEQHLVRALKSGKKISVELNKDISLRELSYPNLEDEKRRRIARKKALEKEGREQ